MEHKLLLCNASNYRRGGPVVTPWQPIRPASVLPDADVTQVRDGHGDPIPFQVDRIDPEDSRHDALALLLPERKLEGTGGGWASAPITLECVAAARPSSKPSEASEPVTRMELNNEVLWVSFSLSASQGPGDAGCFAGAIQSARLGRMEMLDAHEALLGFVESHHSEKRIQLDGISIPNPAWCERQSTEVNLCQLPYSLLSICKGPVREVCTVVSQPFSYEYSDPSNQCQIQLSCQLYRSLILYPGSPYLVEELWLKGKDPQHPDQTANLSFSAHYFAHMDMGFEPKVTWFDHVPDWLAIEYDPNWALFSTYPRPRYGFASNAHILQPKSPHPGYPVKESAHRSFSWELGPSKKACCLHWFQYDAPGEIQSHIGHIWYEFLLAPLWVTTN